VFLHYLAKQTNTKLHIFAQCRNIILLKTSKTHILPIDSLIPLSKQSTADVRSVLSSCEHTPANAFSTRWQQRRRRLQYFATQTSISRCWVRRHCGSASRTHAVAWIQSLV